MVRQLQRPQGLGRQGIGGQQFGGQQFGGPGAVGTRFPTMPGVEPTQPLPPEFRAFLDDLSECIDVLEWEKTLAVQSGQQVAPLVGIADDVAEIGKLTKELVARDSALAPQAIQLFDEASQQALETFQGQQWQVPGVERAISRLTQALDSAGRVQQRFGTERAFQGSLGRQGQLSVGGGQGGQFPGR